MPTKNAERIAQAAVYIDGKPIKGIQELCSTANRQDNADMGRRDRAELY